MNKNPKESQNPKKMSVFPSKWGKYNYMLTFGIGIILGLLGFLVPWLFGVVTDWSDVFLFILTIFGLLTVGISSYHNGWSKNHHAWIAIALIVAIVAILFVGTNYNMKKGSIPLWKISVADCEICFQAETQSTMKAFTLKCNDTTKSLGIQACFKEHGLEKTYQEVKKKIENTEKGHLLDLCCSEKPDQFINNLYSINVNNLVDLLKKIDDPDLQEIIKNAVVKTLIFDCIGFESLKGTIEKYSSCERTPKCCCSDKSKNQDSS